MSDEQDKAEYEHCKQVVAPAFANGIGPTYLTVVELLMRERQAVRAEMQSKLDGATHAVADVCAVLERVTQERDAEHDQMLVEKGLARIYGDQLSALRSKETIRGDM